MGTKLTNYNLMKGICDTHIPALNFVKVLENTDANNPAHLTWQEVELLGTLANEGADLTNPLTGEESEIVGYIKPDKAYGDTVKKLRKRFSKLHIELDHYDEIVRWNYDLDPWAAVMYIAAGASSNNENKKIDGIIIRTDGDNLIDIRGNVLPPTPLVQDLIGEFTDPCNAQSLKELALIKSLSSQDNTMLTDLHDMVWFKGVSFGSPSTAYDGTWIAGKSNCTNVIRIGSKWITQPNGRYTAFSKLRRYIVPNYSVKVKIDQQGNISNDRYSYQQNLISCELLDFGFNAEMLGNTGSAETGAGTGWFTKCNGILVIRTKGRIAKRIVSDNNIRDTWKKIFVPNELIEGYKEDEFWSYHADIIYPIGGKVWQETFVSAPEVYGEVLDEHWDNYSQCPYVKHLINRDGYLEGQFDLLTDEQVKQLQTTLNRIGKLGSASPYANLSAEERSWYLELFPDMYSDYQIPIEDENN